MRAYKIDSGVVVEGPWGCVPADGALIATLTQAIMAIDSAIAVDVVLTDRSGRARHFTSRRPRGLAGGGNDLT